jgi:hypothetical protein
MPADEHKPRPTADAGRLSMRPLQEVACSRAAAGLTGGRGAQDDHAAWESAANRRNVGLGGTISQAGGLPRPGSRASRRGAEGTAP